MQNHPIPQNVTAYEFHLIGNMTIKQFIELGVGVGVGVFFYATGLPDFVKWPLVGASVLIGAAMAFLPFDGRPLDRMVIIFFQAVYAPTQYIWRKTPQVPNFFSYTPQKAAAPDPLVLERLRLKNNLPEYLRTLPSSQSGYQPPYDASELEQLSQVNQLFQQTPTLTTNAPDEVFAQSPKLRIRPLMPVEHLDMPDNLSESLQSVGMNSTQDDSGQITPAVTTLELPSPALPATENQYQPESQIGPQTKMVDDTSQAITNRNLPFPTTPTQPNVIVGMILDTQGKIVEDAIVEIRDKTGHPVRALKSNKLGQFFSATPLNKGTYELEIKKTGLSFDIISLTLNNKIVQPLEIRSKA